MSLSTFLVALMVPSLSPVAKGGLNMPYTCGEHQILIMTFPFQIRHEVEKVENFETNDKAALRLHNCRLKWMHICGWWHGNRR